MPKRATMIEEGTEEIKGAVTAERTYDFTADPSTYEGETKRAYYVLRRSAKLLGTEYPDGKVMTEAEVVAILGEDWLHALVINPGCCG